MLLLRIPNKIHCHLHVLDSTGIYILHQVWAPLKFVESPSLDNTGIYIVHWVWTQLKRKVHQVWTTLEFI
jgi:hypothetical protein